jgi:hypothetical protein
LPLKLLNHLDGDSRIVVAEKLAVWRGVLDLGSGKATKQRSRRTVFCLRQGKSPRGSSSMAQSARTETGTLETGTLNAAVTPTIGGVTPWKIRRNPVEISALPCGNFGVTPAGFFDQLCPVSTWDLCEI